MSSLLERRTKFQTFVRMILRHRMVLKWNEMMNDIDL